jgi:cysteine desulfurase/selenocysteine lyase
VIERMQAYASQEHANVHRGVHRLSQQATTAYEAARESVARFLNAPSAASCIFTRGTTESINLVAATWGKQHLKPGDAVLVSALDHHANIVPWQLLTEATGASLRVIPVLQDGSLDLCSAKDLLGAGDVKLLSLCHVSNALGTIHPVQELTELAHQCGALVLLDGAQAAPHLEVDVQALGCDFYAFSGHKVGGPTGIGVLWGQADILQELPPYQSGGDMIQRVSFTGTTYRGLPERFEAGTPAIEAAIGLAEALEYLMRLDRSGMAAHEAALLQHATQHLTDIDGLRIWGTASEKVPVVSFTMESMHHSDIGMLLDMDGIAIRNGHHCCMPLWEHYGIEGTARASFAYYNTLEEAELLAKSLLKARRMVTGR